ncbi:MAG: hypothetical protein QG608_3768, partial [Actinomycetota bacterium]|nr:hypothetical protein [Actinomycetota bacterium]
LVTAAIIALIAVVVLIATRTRWFQQLWSFTWRNATAAAASTWSWITTNWPSLLGTITGPIGAAGLFITRNWSRITTSFTSAKSRVAGAFSGFFTPLLTGFRSVMNTVIRGWNSLRFTMPSIDTRLPGVGKVGGFSVGVPSIPYLATGGIVTEPTLALLGERGPEAVIPLPRTQDPGPTAVTVHVTGFVGSSRELADAINRALAGNEALGLVPSRRGRWA